MGELDSVQTVIIEGESGEIYTSTHEEGPIDQGGGVDILNGPVELEPAA